MILDVTIFCVGDLFLGFDCWSISPAVGMALPAVSSAVAGTTGNFARFCLPDADEAAKTHLEMGKKARVQRVNWVIFLPHATHFISEDNMTKFSFC